MIDTIRFKIRLSPFQQERIKSKSIETSKYDNTSDNLIFKIYKTDLQLGSYDRNINLFLSESYPEFATLEFSVPKYYYGHNVYLFYITSLESVLENIYKDLLRYFGDFPHYNEWQIFRLDICYAWKFLNDSVAQSVLEVLRSYKISRKKIHNYDTSLMQVGSTYSIKFYLKKPEFYYHDFTHLIHNRYEKYAYEISNIADGVLRFEVTLRASHLRKIFNKSIILWSDLDDEWARTQLRVYLKKFFKGKSPNFMTSQTVLSKLVEKYYSPELALKKKNPNKLAIKLFEYYLTFSSLSTEEQKEYLARIPRSTKYYYDKCLINAGIGIPTKGKINQASLTIPSTYCVNAFTVLPAERREDRCVGVL